MSAAEEKVADAEQRRLALDVTKSFVVQAPAGSGKTGLLVQRFLALLARVDSPEAVLAITFTRKAAGEMRRRILEAIRDAGERSEPPATEFERTRWELAKAVLEKDAAGGWGLLHSPSRLQVFTIDSYCSRIVAGTPLLSRLGSTPRVVEHPRQLYREAARRTLSVAGRAMLGDGVAMLLERYEMGLERLEGQLACMLERRDQWLEGVTESHRDEAEWVARIEAACTEALAYEVEQLARGMETDLLDRIHGIAARSRAAVGGAGEWPTLGDAHRLGAGIESAAAWKQAEKLLVKNRKLRRPKGDHADVYGDDAALKADFRALLEDFDGLSADRAAAWAHVMKTSARLAASPTFAAEGREALRGFLALLRHAAGTLWQIFREHREVDFGQVALSAVDALEPGETLEKLDAKVEHILVDEFQDTSVLQCGLLAGLTSGWQRDGSRTLFLVGDPMQSIYRFRKAEVGLFLAARSRPNFLPGCELTPLVLSVNFRSTRSVIGWVNASFSKLLGDRDDATRSLVAFAEAAPGPRAAQGIDVDFVLWDSPAQPKKADADLVEAAGLADLIAADVEERSARGDARTADTPIAVLVRGRNQALPLLRALEARAPHVRVRAPGLDMLGDRSVVQDLEALARAIVHPGDRLSWLAVLRAPWIGLPLDEIARLVEPSVAATSARRATAVPLLLRDPAALAALREDSRVRLGRLLAIVDAARAELTSRSIDVVVRSAWLRLGGSSGAAAEVDALDAEAFFDLLASRARGGSVDLDDLALALAETEAAVDVEGAADVEVMTMHKAKGLEFDTVILPALASKTGGNTALPLALETDPATGMLTMMAPREARGRDDTDGDKFGFLELREKRREEAENLRVLYVAATRAKRRLVLSAAWGRLKKDGTAASGTLLAAMAPALSISDARVAVVGDQGAAPRPPQLRFPAEPTLGRVPASVADRSVESQSPSDLAETTPQFFADSRISAHIGTVYHAFVERIAREGLAAWSTARVVSERTAIEHALRSAGALPSEMANATERVMAALQATLHDEKGRLILGAAGAEAEARSEWAVMRYRDRRLTSAAVDRTFVHDGVRWIVDFKTGRLAAPDGEEGEGTTEVERIAQKRAQYAAQLATYRDLLRAHAAAGDALPIRLALYFPEWPEGRRWQPIDDETLPAV